ncbi:MAG: rhodanese-like domain-containing protein [Candidatus Omnitrophota bacterium]
MVTRVYVLAAAVVLICVSAFAMCGSCGPGDESKEAAMGTFSRVTGEAAVKAGVREITYDQFMAIRGSGEGYKLLDVLSQDSYSKGHIEGAASFPLDTINETTAAGMLSKGDNIIVYCGSFQCTASTQAAGKLSGLGYNVLDYKGGLKEWQEKGNGLVSGN